MNKVYCDKCGKEIRHNKEKYHCNFPNLEEYNVHEYDFCEECYYDIMCYIRNVKNEQYMV